MVIPVKILSPFLDIEKIISNYMVAEKYNLSKVNQKSNIGISTYLISNYSIEPVIKAM